MGTGASGTSAYGMVNGYKSLSRKCLEAVWDASADWSEAKAEIDANRPVASSVPGHVRLPRMEAIKPISYWYHSCKMVVYSRPLAMEQ